MILVIMKSAGEAKGFATTDGVISSYYHKMKLLYELIVLTNLIACYE